MTRGEKKKIQNQIDRFLAVVDRTTNCQDQLEVMAWIECLKWVLYYLRYDKTED